MAGALCCSHALDGRTAYLHAMWASFLLDKACVSGHCLVCLASCRMHGETSMLEVEVGLKEHPSVGFLTGVHGVSGAPLALRGGGIFAVLQG